MNALAEKYLRKSALPTLFCPGCGDGTILSAMVKTVDKIGIERFCFVSGIGCSGWIPVFINADVIHALHGRSIPVATGLKLAQMDRKVVVFSGDGDCLGIGGGHFIHAARRNIDLTVVMVNNSIYGMTGGQVAPTTPLGASTKTSPYGNSEPPFDACALAVAAGATFVSRQTAIYPRKLQQALERAVEHKGFSFVEVVTQCPTQAGRNIFKSGQPEFLFRELKRRAVLNPEQQLEPEQFYIGTVYHDESRPAYRITAGKGD